MSRMTGPQHVAEAERLFEQADADVSENHRYLTGEHKTDVLLAANYHVGMALLHATVEARQVYPTATRSDNEKQWRKALR